MCIKLMNSYAYIINKLKNNVVYASLKVYKDLYENNIDLFILGKNVYVKGYLNSYSDKNKTIHNYVTVTKIESYDFINT